MNETMTMPMWTFWFIMVPWLLFGSLCIIAIIIAPFTLWQASRYECENVRVVNRDDTPST